MPRQPAQFSLDGTHALGAEFRAIIAGSSDMNRRLHQILTTSPSGDPSRRTGVHVRAVAQRRCSAAALLLVAVTACTNRGNGEPATVDRSTPEFHAVEIGGVFVLDAAPGPTAKVTLGGDANLLDLVETEVVDGELRVTTTASIAPRMDLVVTVRAPGLDAISTSGASRAEVRGISGRTFQIEASGASTATVAGEIAELEIEASGSSSVAARELRSERAQVASSGAAEVELTATTAISASASGASEIRFCGSPSDITRTSSGSAAITPCR